MQEGTSSKTSKKKKNTEIMKMFNMCWPRALFSGFHLLLFMQYLSLIACHVSAVAITLLRFFWANSTCALWRNHPTAWEAQATWGCARSDRGLRKREIDGRAGQNSKCRRGDWEPQVSLLIYQLCSWQPRGIKWMCGPQGSGGLCWATETRRQWVRGIQTEWMMGNCSLIPDTKCALGK